MTFADRYQAGDKLADKLEGTHKHVHKPVVYALPRGGVILGAAVAKRLGAPLDLAITRKIGHPDNPEYAICAVGQFGEPICNQAEMSGVNPDWLKQQIELQKQEIDRRRQLYLNGNEMISPKHKTAILVDDGIATGLTMLAAINDMRALGAKRVLVAVPVAPADKLGLLKGAADEVITLSAPTFFRGAIGAYYDDFSQVSDEVVIKILNDSRKQSLS